MSWIFFPNTAKQVFAKTNINNFSLSWKYESIIPTQPSKGRLKLWNKSHWKHDDLKYVDSMLLFDLINQNIPNNYTSRFKSLTLKCMWFYCKELEEKTNQLWGKRGMSLGSTQQWNGLITAANWQTQDTHTHTPLTYIYNMSICNIAPVCNIVFGTVTIHLAAKHLENDMWPNHHLAH